MILTAKANAKINLSLDITGALPDGYHSLTTVMQSVSLHDTVTVEERKTTGIILHCDQPGVPADERNTAFRAAALYYAAVAETPHVEIHIEKRIPSEAGLGGGSADAAAVLKALNSLHGDRLSDSRMADVALQIGADVPFCLTGGTALCKNKGEQMSVLPPFNSHVVLLKPASGVSTAQAYRAFDTATALTHPDNDRLLRCFAAGEYKTGLQYAGNLFEQLVSLPEGEQIKRAFYTGGAYYAAMSGSGAAFFGLFTSAGAAQNAARALQGTLPFVCVCETADRGVEFAQ